MFRINRERGRGRGRAKEAVAVVLWRRDQKARDLPGQSGLADPARSRDQPAVVQTACVEDIQKPAFRRLLPKDHRRLTRVRRAVDLVGLGQGVVSHSDSLTQISARQRRRHPCFDRH